MHKCTTAWDARGVDRYTWAPPGKRDPRVLGWDLRSPNGVMGWRVRPGGGLRKGPACGLMVGCFPRGRSGRAVREGAVVTHSHAVRSQGQGRGQGGRSLRPCPLPADFSPHPCRCLRPLSFYQFHRHLVDRFTSKLLKGSPLRQGPTEKQVARSNTVTEGHLGRRGACWEHPSDSVTESNGARWGSAGQELEAAAAGEVP